MPLTCYAANNMLCPLQHVMPLTTCYAANSTTEICKTSEHVALHCNEFCKISDISQSQNIFLTHVHLGLDFVYWCRMMVNIWPNHVACVIQYHVIILLCLTEICNVLSVNSLIGLLWLVDCLTAPHDIQADYYVCMAIRVFL